MRPVEQAVSRPLLLRATRRLTREVRRVAVVHDSHPSDFPRQAACGAQQQRAGDRLLDWPHQEI
ncbi:hypothetical protein ACFVY9_14615 [Streptomyces sp. NPDC059544]|uniref:hypothetical protein n=1 Tax=Streptomyces sp. NPDC059544 TaxID=3346861 RepID=UPI00369D8052